MILSNYFPYHQSFLHAQEDVQVDYTLLAILTNLKSCNHHFQATSKATMDQTINNPSHTDTKLLNHENLW